MRIWINGYGRFREWINGYRRLETMDMDIGPSWGENGYRRRPVPGLPSLSTQKRRMDMDMGEKRMDKWI